MKNNVKILIIIIAALTLSSAILLYRSFSSHPLTIVQPTVSARDVVIRSQVQSLQVKINKAVSNIESGGSLDALVGSEQFKELSSDSVVQIVAGDHGRGNPFIPPQISR